MTFNRKEAAGLGIYLTLLAGTAIYCLRPGTSEHESHNSLAAEQREFDLNGNGKIDGLEGHARDLYLRHEYDYSSMSRAHLRK